MSLVAASSAPGFRSAVVLIAAALAIAARLAPPASAQDKLTLVQQTWVVLDVVLIAQDRLGRTTEARETLRGRAGERLAFATPLAVDEGALTVGVMLAARPDRRTGTLRVGVEAEVVPQRRRPTTTTRQLVAEPGRTALAELWRDPSSRAGVVLALTGRWEEVPEVARFLPGSEPLDLVLEVLAREGDQETLLEQHRLGGLVGSPTRYDVSLQTDGAGSSERVVVELLPQRIVARDLTIGARLSRDGATTPQAQIEELTVPSGFSFELTLPVAEGRSLLVRVTPFF